MTAGLLFTTLGYLTGAVVLVWAARQRKLLTDGMMRISAFALLGGIVGAKLSEFLFEGWPFRISFAAIFDPSLGGKALLGGIAGGWIAAEIAKRRMGIRRSTGDLFAYALPAGEAIGRIGCYFNGCCYGKATNCALAIFQHGAWRHPTQIYSAITAALIFLAVVLARKSVPREGDLFKLYLVLFGVSRFLIEFLREGPTLFWGLTAMQWFCIELATFGAVGLLMSFRRRHADGHELATMP